MEDTETARQRRRDAVVELGEAMRALVQVAVATEVDAETIRAAATLVRDAATPLGERVRDRHRMASVDDLPIGLRHYNPVIGLGSAFAPPLVITHADGRAEATCTLGLAYEGPPTFVHGGVSAMLLDQLLGHIVVHAGRPGMTRDLVMSYRAPVPLQTPLHLFGEISFVAGRRIVATATIATAADPDTILVEATGTFVALTAEQTDQLFARYVGR